MYRIVTTFVSAIVGTLALLVAPTVHAAPEEARGLIAKPSDRSRLVLTGFCEYRAYAIHATTRNGTGRRRIPDDQSTQHRDRPRRPHAVLSSGEDRRPAFSSFVVYIPPEQPKRLVSG
jgi:hypothetical protein